MSHFSVCQFLTSASPARFLPCSLFPVVDAEGCVYVMKELDECGLNWKKRINQIKYILYKWTIFCMFRYSLLSDNN